MAFNKYMHPRNCYRNRKPEFKSLAVKYPDFRKHVTQDLRGKVYFDFKSADALRTLCICLLNDDFDLEVELPTERLVPTVPLRLNYIHWIEDLINLKKDAFGIDIGTGACCIYPLLGCRLNDWKFLATEVDDINLHFAEKNVTANELQDRITVKKVAEEGNILLDVVEDQTERSYDFCMCNPPFFIDNLEAQGITSTRKDDRTEPSSVNTASSSECVADGGEVAFIKRIIEESMQLKNKIRVYTSMVGKKSSLPLLKHELKEKQITNFGVTEFCQGKTMRWGIAWTFDPTVKFTGSEFKASKKEKPPLEYIIPATAIPEDTKYFVPAIWKRIKGILKELKFQISSEKTGKTYATAVATANENTWSHQRKKRREKQRCKQMDCKDENSSDCVKERFTENHDESDETEDNNSKLISTHTETCVSSSIVIDAITTTSNTDNQNINTTFTHSCEVSRKRKNEDAQEIPNKFAKHDVSDNDDGEKETPIHLQACSSDKNAYILKCSFDLKWEKRQIVLKLQTKDRDKREALHQVLQYIKNQFHGNNN